MYKCCVSHLDTATNHGPPCLSIPLSWQVIAHPPLDNLDSLQPVVGQMPRFRHPLRQYNMIIVAPDFVIQHIHARLADKLLAWDLMTMLSGNQLGSWRIGGLLDRDVLEVKASGKLDTPARKRTSYRVWAASLWRASRSSGPVHRNPRHARECSRCTTHRTWW